ncbi:MAG: ribonuclease R, partial [Planctomycetaceae bacterium]|nr:ribonuclease R [Planctomycetaceae bacterium]
MNIANLEQQLLQHIRATNYRPVKPRVIARQLDLPEERFSELRRTIKKLVKRGELAYGPKHLVMPSKTQAQQESLTGTFQRHPDGYGFVRLPRDAKNPKRDDVYIPRSQTQDAATGDQVRIRTKRSRRGNSSRVSG